MFYAIGTMSAVKSRHTFGRSYTLYGWASELAQNRVNYLNLELAMWYRLYIGIVYNVLFVLTGYSLETRFQRFGEIYEFCLQGRLVS